MEFHSRFVGRRILITGASSGLGAHFATVLAQYGTVLALAARREERLVDVARQCRERGAERVLTLALDVTDEIATRAVFSRLSDEFGGLDVLVNNAGIANAKPALDYTIEEVEAIIGTNLRGVWLCSLAAMQLMKSQGAGDIVNIASILGLRVAGNVAPYAVSKAGVIQMTRAHAVEWATWGIRVNALAPGYIETELNSEFFGTEAGRQMIERIPMKRLGQLRDLDAPLLLLCSGLSEYLTGAVITVDGAHHLNEL
jgi:NAD(P)-dependent dehydrogenase (short-subunit alcohol dehydrogenase family)